MQKVTCLTGFILVFVFCSLPTFATEKGLVAHWKFDEEKGNRAIDRISQKEDSICGNFQYIQGAYKTGMKFDGSTTYIIRKAKDVPHFTDAFSVEAWIAPQTYPMNWCAILDQEREHKAGYYFGINDMGQLGLHLVVNGKWEECTSKEKIPYMKWSHIAGTFNRKSGITVYINGEEVAQLPVKGKLVVAGDVDLWIGRNHKKLRATALVREFVGVATLYSINGIIDELKIYNRMLTAKEIEHAYRANKPESDPPLTRRKPLQIPPGPFGAVYCKLRPNKWFGDHPDVVVRFGEKPYNMVFRPFFSLVTNGQRVGSQTAEIFGDGIHTIGCCEGTSDRQRRYARVRIIENNDARVVVHCRYALCDVFYRISGISGPDSLTDWGNWADEYFYIYPDGVRVRFFAVHGVTGCSIHEPNIYNEPGEKPEDNISLNALTVANMAGEIRTYSWEKWPSDGGIASPFTNELPNQNISLLNIKAEYKPFYIYEPGTRIIPYGGGLAEVPKWTHFPTFSGGGITDGRLAVALDRGSASCITSPEPPMKRRVEDNALVGRFILGVSNEPIEKHIILARSWLRPPELNIDGNAFSSKGYSRDQRVYIVRKETKGSEPLEFKLSASEESPIVNPAFVIKNWGKMNATLKINGRKVKRSKDFRYGHRYQLKSTDLIVWIKYESMKPIKISLSPML